MSIKLSSVPIKTGPGSSGSQTSLDLTTFPFNKVISSPDLSLPSKGPGGTPSLTHFSKFKAPGLGWSLQMKAIEVPKSFISLKINLDDSGIDCGEILLPVSKIILLKNYYKM